MTVKFSCVMDKNPRFGEQALVWASSLLVYGGQVPDSLVIHTVGECVPEHRRIFDNWEIDVRIVQRFDERHPNSNKLAQLESEALHSADYVVLCDCDLAFCSDISFWMSGDTIRARIASSAGLPLRRWRNVFELAGIPLPKARVQALVTRVTTLPSYCNGGFYIIPHSLFHTLREVWPRWDRWLLDHNDLIQPFSEFDDQISFAMSCEELGVIVDRLPIHTNFDTVYIPREFVNEMKPVIPAPLVLHYHRLNSQGLLRPTRIPSVNRRIRKINDLMLLAKRVDFHLPTLLLLREARPVPYERTNTASVEAC